MPPATVLWQQTRIRKIPMVTVFTMPVIVLDKRGDFSSPIGMDAVTTANGITTASYTTRNRRPLRALQA